MAQLEAEVNGVLSTMQEAGRAYVATVRQHGERLVEIGRGLDAAARRLDEVRAEVAAADRTKAGLDAELTERRAALERARNDVNAAGVALTQRRGELAAVEEEITTRRAALAQLEAALAAIKKEG
jgi:chromosome segregation ATPase